MSEDLERRLRRLEAIEDIRRLKLRYGALCDSGYPPDALAELFTEDGVWDGGEVFGVFRGRGAIRDLFAAIETDVFSFHYLVGDEIEVDGDGLTARGTWRMLELATLILAGEQHAMWMAAVYADEYRFEEDGWKFTSVKVNFRLQAKHLDGWAGNEMQL